MADRRRPSRPPDAPYTGRAAAAQAPAGQDTTPAPTGPPDRLQRRLAMAMALLIDLGPSQVARLATPAQASLLVEIAARLASHG